MLHEDAEALRKRKEDIKGEFRDGSVVKFALEYDDEHKYEFKCPACGENLLAKEENFIRCKLCNSKYKSLNDLHKDDHNCIHGNYVLRELGRRKNILKFPIHECSNCEYEAVVFQPQNQNWICLNCGKDYYGLIYCDECGIEIPDDNGIRHIAMSDYDTEDYKYLCPTCAKNAKDDERYIGYYFDNEL